MTATGSRTGTTHRCFIESLDPRSRLLGTGLFAALVVALDHLPALGLALGIAIAAVSCVRLAPRILARRMLALDGFVIFAVLSLPFTLTGTPWFTVFGVEASREGVTAALTILLKANAVMLMLLALLGTLETVVLGQTLRRLGMPAKLVQLLLFTIRYIDVLQQEYERLRLAMRARAFHARTNGHTWRSLGYLIGMMMVRAIERAERVSAAMRCRGFDGHFRRLEPPSRFCRPDGVFAALALMVASLTLLPGLGL